MENLVELLIGGTNLAVVNVAILLGFSFLGSFIIVTMGIGGGSLVVATFVAAACKERQTYVATHATLMSIQHGLKVVAFGLLGFSFGPYLPLLAGLLVFGFAGTYIGKLVLMHLPEAMFRTGLKIVLTLIALRLLYGAITS